MAKLNSYSVLARVDIQVSVSVNANSLDEALDKSKKLKIDNFVDILGQWMDGRLKITGVYED